MKSYSILFATIAVAILVAHVGTFYLHSNGHIVVSNRSFYFCASSGTLLVGTMSLGSLGALFKHDPAVNIQRKPGMEIEGIGRTRMTIHPSVDRGPSSSVESPIWPGFAVPILLFLIPPMAWLWILLRKYRTS